MPKPLIGIILDHEKSGSYSDLPHYALREHYFTAIEAAGGVPVGIGYTQRAEDSLDHLSGLVSPGGQFETPRDWYLGGSGSTYAASDRLPHDIALIDGARAREMPLLAICAGMQVLAGINGCKLTPDLTTAFGRAVNHRAASVLDVRHAVHVKEGTRLARALGQTNIIVNSHHREAVVQTAPGVIVSAASADGVIEAIELAGPGFALGVQWHPEIALGDGDPSRRIFDAFVAEAQAYRP